MTKVRIIYNNLWRMGTILAKSSQHPQFPVEDSQIDTPLQPWITRYGAGSGNGSFTLTETYGADLVSNGAFTANTTGWTGTDCTLASVAGGASGNCLQMTRTGATGQYASSGAITLESGSLYRIWFYVKSGTAGNVAFKVSVGTSAVGDSTDGSVSGTSSGAWTPYSFVVKAGAASRYLHLKKDSADAGTILFDTVILVKITSGNVYIDFDEGGAELTAQISSGVYTGASLAAEIQAQMTAAGGTYTVTYSETTAKITIAKSSGNFTLRLNTGTHAAAGFGATAGFAVTADKSGAGSYESDYRRIHYPAEYADKDLLTASQYNVVAIFNHNFGSSAVITFFGADDAAFTTNVVSDTLTWAAGDIVAFLAAARTKRYVRIHVQDPTNPNSYLQFGNIFLGTYWEPTISFLAPFEDGPEDASEVEESDALVKYAREKPILDVMTLPFRLTDSDKATAVLFMKTVGITKSFIVCWDYTAPNTNFLLAGNVELNVPTYNAPDNWDWAMTIKGYA